MSSSDNLACLAREKVVAARRDENVGVPVNETLAASVFSGFDQDRFADLSGDRNPMHVDPIAARRTQAGAPVVHGMHAVLWALEHAFGTRSVPDDVAALAVRFQKFIPVGAHVELRLTRATERSWRAEIHARGVVAATIDVSAGPAQRDAAPLLGVAMTTADVPAERELSELADLNGVLPRPARHELSAAFPAVARVLGAERVASLASLSTLVGMVVPGLHSIFSGFTVAIVDLNPLAPDVTFAVRDVDERVRLVEIAVEGGGIRGTVSAFARQPPVKQLRLGELQALVKPGEFAHCRALVIGGSRGLGALTAGIIVAGGGTVALTYAAGIDDAFAVAEDLKVARACVFRYDARESAEPQLEQLASDVNQMYYFATTQISRVRSSWYSAEVFGQFNDIYVDGFARACSGLRGRQELAFTAFYPSSVAVADRPRDFTEYAMAKAAGEVMCADINRFARGFKVLVKRLPRVLTDQTATVMPVESADPVEVMLPIVREMSATGTTPH